MVTVTEHTRRKAGAECLGCKRPIEPGERYRQLVAVAHDAFNDAFTRWTAHTCCVWDEELWALTGRTMTDDELEALIGAAEFQFWVCPKGCSSATVRARPSPNLPRITVFRGLVEWDGDTATCMTCGQCSHGWVPTGCPRNVISLWPAGSDHCSIRRGHQADLDDLALDRAISPDATTTVVVERWKLGEPTPNRYGPPTRLYLKWSKLSDPACATKSVPKTVSKLTQARKAEDAP